MFVNSYSLKYLGIDREIVNISLPEFAESISYWEWERLASPRIKQANGKTFYLSNGYVIWVNSPSSSKWREEIKFLEDSGLQWGRDMVIVKWSSHPASYSNKQYATTDNNLRMLDCPWIELVSVQEDDNWAKFRVLPNKLFRGFSTKVIKGD